MTSIVFDHVGVIDGCGGVKSDTTVVVEGDRITAIGGTDYSPPTDARVIDGTDHWLMPGLINCHDHLSHKWIRWATQDEYHSGNVSRLHTEPGPRALESAKYAAWTVRQGVTTIRDLGSAGIAAGPEMFTNVHMRDAIGPGMPGPKILASRLMIAMTGGHGTPWFGVREADGVEEVRKAVREQIKGGADCIKVMSTGGLSNYPHERPDIDQYTVDELTAAATETHRFGKLIATHAMSDRAVSRAIQAGIDTIEHAFLASADGIKLMADSDIAFVPTARVSWRTARTASPELASLLSEANHAQRILEASELGVKIGVGTDSRFTMIEEMETLVDYGMPVQSVIQGATGTAADICGLEGIGIVAPGMTADLLLLGSNPLNGLRSAFEKLKMVVQRGEITVSASDASVALRPMTPPGPLD